MAYEFKNSGSEFFVENVLVDRPPENRISPNKEQRLDGVDENAGDSELEQAPPGYKVVHWIMII